MENENYRPVTVGEWMVTYLLLFIPLVNLILLFVWAFGGNAPVSKANFAKASLIWILISIVLSIILSLTIGATLFAFLKSS